MATTELAARGAAVTITTGLELARTVPTAPWVSRIEEHPSWEMLSQMRVTMRAEISLHRFKVRDLLALAEGQVFESLSPDTEDVPLKIGQVQLGWGEFEVVEQRMALRLTRLA
jgi:flagellar motor switch/type III secretory pathway protein FliN